MAPSLSLSTPLPALSVVTSVSNIEVLQKRLHQSPCLRRGGLPWAAYFNSSSAAAAFNQAMDAAAATAHSTKSVDWLVWVHQDVFLPEGWDTQFQRALHEARIQWPSLAVAGVYGVHGTGDDSWRAGQVLDRGQLLQESRPLPCLVDSLDELLVAVRVDSGLRMDPAMGFDFYATDLALQAKEIGLCTAVVDAFCEHWSDTPAQGLMPSGLIERVKKNAQAFEHKWIHQLPVKTPCFEIQRPGDVAAFVNKICNVAP